MRFLGNLAFVGLMATLSSGCAGLHKQKAESCPPGEAASEGVPKCDRDKDAKTLLNWATCKEEEKPENGAAPAAPTEEKAECDTVRRGRHCHLFAPTERISISGSPASENGNSRGMANLLTGNGSGKSDEEPLVTDRPDFTEASTTVGKGRVQIEAGYTYFRDRENGVTTHAHSYPEILTRIGLFRDWFELRIGQNFASESIRPRTAGNGASGATDLYLGTKTALTEQKGIFPETAVIFQMTVPTGSRTFTNNKVLPGVSLLYSWDLSDRYSFAGSVLGNKAIDEDGHGYTEFANSFSLGTSITEKIGNYIEYFAFYPHSGSAAGLKPRYFMNSGFTYLVNPNMQLDIRAGVGLNKAADDFFIGSGLAVRY